ncbi:hypothetical protein BC941DRAFT_418940 [Chlamydoabsidia padenii]|nr:hypothetical protein BC941DRAFT_418940 [Chlamydoabsidia padenii]
MPHTFNTCPLRCFSLFIVDSLTHKIVLATKEICTLLGYLPSQLIGQNLTVLNLQHLDDHHCVFRHESSHSRVAFKVCTHHEPTLGLDYWCLHAVSPQWNSNTGLYHNNMDMPSHMNILRLDSRGIINYCLGNDDYLPMVGRSLPSLIHMDDRQRLVDGLNEQRQTTFQVLFLRLLTNDDTTAKHHDKNYAGVTYHWICLTMLTVPKRRSYGGVHYDDIMSRQQLVIIRPATHPSTPSTFITSSSSSSSSSSSFMIWSFRGLQAMRIMFGFCLGLALEAWFTTWGTIYQGQRYLVEFLAHLLISVLDFLADCIDPAPPLTSSVRVVLGHEELQKQQQQNSHNNEHITLITEVPWLRPRHRKRWATAVRTLRKRVQSNTMARKSLGVLETIGVVQSSNMFDYLEKVTSDRNQTSIHHPPIKNKLC